VIYLPECHSTNELAAQLVTQEAINEGTIVITDKQTKGKGQRGNTWNTEPGKNITCTLILRPNFLKITEQFSMTMVISMALHDVFSLYLSQENIYIKWPNDLYVGDKKCAGVLIENGIKSNKIDYMLVGMGVNINQREFPIETASSLSRYHGNDLSIHEVLEKHLISIEKYYLMLKNGGFSRLRKKYLEKLLWKDEWHEFLCDKGKFNGKIIGVDPLGRLVIDTADGQKSFDIKEVSFEK